MPSSTVSPTDSPVQRRPLWTRISLAVCALAVILWTLRPGAGRGFQPVPIAPLPAPAWTLTNAFGQVLSSSNYAGHVLVVNFWATWCPPCIREIPDLNAFHLAHTNDRVAVLGFSVDQGKPAEVDALLRDFATRNQLAYPIVAVPKDVAEAYSAVGPIPTTFVIGRDGRFAARYVGAVTREELERVTARLRASPATL